MRVVHGGFAKDVTCCKLVGTLSIAVQKRRVYAGRSRHQIKKLFEMRFTVVRTRQNQQRDTTTWGIVDARDDDTSQPVVVKSSFWPLPSLGCVFQECPLTPGRIG